MTSDLRHSIPDGIAHTELSLTRQIGLHVAGTALSMNFLLATILKQNATASKLRTASIIGNLSKSLQFFAENSSLIDILLNQEEVYLAAQILGVGDGEIDATSEAFWQAYQDMKADILLASDDDSSLFESLGQHVLGDRHTLGVIQYELVIDGIPVGR